MLLKVNGDSVEIDDGSNIGSAIRYARNTQKQGSGGA